MKNMKNCPKCKIEWEEKENIYEYFLAKGYSEEKAMDTAEMYGHTNENPKYFGKNCVGIETEGYDGVSYWKCTSCNTVFDRWTMKESDKKFDFLEDSEEK